jgi:hypothetical protein
MFRWEGNQVVNEKGKVLDVQDGLDAEGRNCIFETNG